MLFNDLAIFYLFMYGNWTSEIIVLFSCASSHINAYSLYMFFIRKHMNKE